MPLPRPPRTSNGRPEKKWVEARRRAGGRVPAKKYMFRMSSGLSVQDATREHVFKNCPQWKTQQKTLWAEAHALAEEDG